MGQKQQSRFKRTLIGKVDPNTGEIVPTRPYKKKSYQVSTVTAKRRAVPITNVRRCFYGASYLLDQIGQAADVIFIPFLVLKLDVNFGLKY